MATESCSKCPPLEVCRHVARDGASNHKTEVISSEAFFAHSDTIPASLTIIFAQADAIRDCAQCKKRFSHAFHMPELWWAPWCRRSNSYFGSEETFGSDGHLDGYSTWLRFLIKKMLRGVPPDQKDYLWLKYNIYTRWTMSTNETTLIIFDPRQEVKDGLLSALMVPQDKALLRNPFWIHVQIVQEVVRLQDMAVWTISEMVRGLEKKREDPRAPNPNYARVHDMARHAIHVSETTTLGVRTMEHVLAKYDLFASDTSKDEGSDALRRRQIAQRLRFFEHMFYSLQCRSAANKDRLLNEIHLAFNTVAQYDSSVSVEIARSTLYDSFIMKTIAFLTLAFFPATFISALFSMSFFNFDPHGAGWTVSEQFWVYWAVALPVTAATVLLWFGWQKIYPPDLLSKVQLRPRGELGPARVDTLKTIKSLVEKSKAETEMTATVTV